MEYFATGDASSIDGMFIVNVMSTAEITTSYYGVNVIFRRNDAITADTYCARGSQEALDDFSQIMQAAKDAFSSVIERHMSGEDVGDYTTLPRK